MTGKNLKRLGDALRKAREAKHLSTRDVGRLTTIAHTTITRVEKGEFAAPSPEKLTKLARILELEAEDLFALAGYETPDGLPDYTIYLRTKFEDLPEQAVRQLEKQFREIRELYASKSKGGRRARRINPTS